MTPFKLDFSRKGQLSLMEMLMIKTEASSLDLLVYRECSEELTDCYFPMSGCFELLTEYHLGKQRKSKKQFRFSLTENP